MSDEPEPSEDASSLRARLEEATRRAAEAEAEAQGLRQREVFRDAGFDLQNKQHQAFAKFYDGDLDPEAVKSYATEMGVTQTPTPPANTDPAPEDEQQRLTQIAEAAMGGGAPPPQPNVRDGLAQQMAAAARKGDKQTLDRLSMEFSRAGGFQVAD